jgi:hypothetical protein
MKEKSFLFVVALFVLVCRDEPRRIQVTPIVGSPPPSYGAPPQNVVTPMGMPPARAPYPQPVGQPMMGQPVGQPMVGQPMVGQPMMGQPIMGQPMGQPVGQPAPQAPAQRSVASPQGKAGTPTYKLEAEFGDKIRYLGYDLDKPSLKAGEEFTITHYYQAIKEIPENWKIFIHVESPYSGFHRSHGDHFPADGQYPTNRWRPGEVIKDAVSLRVHPNFLGRNAKVWSGFYIDDTRLSVSKGFQDGENRILSALIPVVGAAPEAKSLEVAWRKGAIAVDGVLGEDDWKAAPSTGRFVSVQGGGATKNRTEAKMLWDTDGLYVAYECDDEDIKSTFTKRDDSLWEQEAVELFVDASGDEMTYAEFQVSPGGQIFDAWFTIYGPPGQRGGDILGYNPPIDAKVKVDGTLNASTDADKGWTVEMKIPWAAFRDVQGRAPKNGDVWRANLYRVDKPQGMQGDDGAWNVPQGDYHALHGFGTLRFTGRPESAAPTPAPTTPTKPPAKKPAKTR